MNLMHVQTGFTPKAFMGGMCTNIRLIEAYAERTRSHIECLIYISLFNLIAFLGFITNNGIPILGVKKSTSEKIE